MKAVHFGAGNIGRGFIGLALARSDYEVIFVDVNEELVRMINALRSYPVIVASVDEESVQWVDNIRALSLRDIQAVSDAVACADIVTTSVGKSALPACAPVISAGLARRVHAILPVMVIACENVLGNSAYLREWIVADAGKRWSFYADAAVFPDCMVDRIVPIAPARIKELHPLAVLVEEYADWVIDGTSLSHRVPIVGARYTDSLEAVLAQKLFTLNMAHAIVGYYGYLAGYAYIHEAMRNEDIRALLMGALHEGGAALAALYGIESTLQAMYAARIIARLENPVLYDEVRRVAREPKRKLGPSDRLIRPALAAVERGVVPAHLATGIAAALAYDVAEDREARELATLVKTSGIKYALGAVSGVPEDHMLAELVHSVAHFRSL